MIANGCGKQVEIGLKNNIWLTTSTAAKKLPAAKRALKSELIGTLSSDRQKPYTRAGVLTAYA